VLRYKDLALKDTARREVMLQYVCEAYRWQHNDSAYVATLRQGFAEYPEHTYFFPRLADWLNTQGKTQEVLELSESGLKENQDNQLFLLARSSALLTLERYDECIDTSERLIALNDTMPEAYLNIATVRLNQALDVEEEREPRKNHRRLQKLYQQARPYMEAYRQLAPKEERRWAPGLYRIYLNLNMGKQFDEIDRIMRKWNN
jgi:tetratricopeptide (TPR) repeat protein